ncbi:hypothetical protein B0H19DRAFT_1270873 [Mycena capillaripes]|nr:hypothetical protein B0H19DRAFT_1270873 [Mycena capillaripes]
MDPPSLVYLSQISVDFLHLKRFLALQHPLSTFPIFPGQRRAKRVGAIGLNVGRDTYDPLSQNVVCLPYSGPDLFHLKRFLALQHPLSTLPMSPGQRRAKRVGAIAANVGPDPYDSPHKRALQHLLSTLPMCPGQRSAKRVGAIGLNVGRDTYGPPHKTCIPSRRSRCPQGNVVRNASARSLPMSDQTPTSPLTKCASPCNAPDVPRQRRAKRVGAIGLNVGRDTYDPLSQNVHPVSTLPMSPGQRRAKRVGAIAANVGLDTYDPPHKMWCHPLSTLPMSPGQRRAKRVGAIAANVGPDTYDPLDKMWCVSLIFDPILFISSVLYPSSTPPRCPRCLQGSAVRNALAQAVPMSEVPPIYDPPHEMLPTFFPVLGSRAIPMSYLD